MKHISQKTYSRINGENRTFQRKLIAIIFQRRIITEYGINTKNISEKTYRRVSGKNTNNISMKT